MKCIMNNTFRVCFDKVRASQNFYVKSNRTSNYNYPKIVSCNQLNYHYK